MESLYILVPLSVLIVLAMIGVFAWALHSGQFDDLSKEAWRPLHEDDRPDPLDSDQAPGGGRTEQ